MESTVKEYHRIEAKSHDLLWAAMERKVQQLTGDEKIEYKKRIDDFIHKYPLVHSLKLRKEKHVSIMLSYEILPEFLEAAGFSWYDMLCIVSSTEEPPIKPEWANSFQKLMCKLLDGMTNKQRKNAEQLFRSYVAPSILNLLDENDPLQGRRICDILSLACDNTNSGKKLFSNLGIEYKWNTNKTYSTVNAVPFSKMPAIAQRSGCSLYWMLGLDDDVVLAKNPDTEKAMVYFCFMSESLQELLCKGTEIAFYSGGLNCGD